VVVALPAFPGARTQALLGNRAVSPVPVFTRTMPVKNGHPSGSRGRVLTVGQTMTEFSLTVAV
jgi:hypothetical protein